MNKSLLYFATFSMVVLGCSKQEDECSDFNIEETNTLVPIEIGANGSSIFVNAATKGTGTAGYYDTNDSTWKWNNDTVRVFILRKGTLQPCYSDYNSQSSGISEGDVLSYNTPWIAKKGAEYTSLIAPNNKTRYYCYGGDSIVDFWAYSLNQDAIIGKPYIVDTTECLQLKFKLNGTQDLMTASKAQIDQNSAAYLSLTSAESKYVKSHTFNAFCAIKKLQPDMSFKHALTRLTFNVIAGDSSVTNSAKAFKVKAITIKSKYEGALNVAYLKTPKSVIEWNDSSFIDMKLHDKGKSTLKEVQPIFGGKGIGDCLLVAPQSSYEMVITTTQLDESGKELSYNYYGTLKPSGSKKSFTAGNTYTVNLTMYSLQKMDITAKLQAWTNGGTITFDPEK